INIIHPPGRTVASISPHPTKQIYGSTSTPFIHRTKPPQWRDPTQTCTGNDVRRYGGRRVTS
ncbi:hypothetical protein FRC16_007035, partial [Serendipita sp. 398]